MESEIEQLKNEIEQLKKKNMQLNDENEDLRKRYVPENKNFKQCVIVKIDEDSDIIIIKLSCSSNPRINDKKDVDGETIYARNLPNAEYFKFIVFNDILKLLETSYRGYWYKNFTFHIDNADWNGDRTELTNDIRNTLNYCKYKLKWSDYPDNSDNSDEKTD